tara:strand:+ start:501 stop:683 length:183 start_codon:yes stop_codon:yes gene_type:complete
MYHGDSSHRYLNPNFCEWLMGMEIGSTCLAKTVSELLGMGLSPTRQHSLGENCGVSADGT